MNSFGPVYDSEHGAASRQGRILLVDDEPQILQTFSIILRDEGYEVLEASNGRQALAITRERRPDVVLLDVMLPDISGLKVCRQIKATKDLPDVFVILFSGRAVTPADKADGLEGGADDYLAKPINIDELRARIRTVMRLRDTTAALRASEKHYRQLVEILPEAVGLIDPQGRLITVNPQAVEMLGYESAEELLAKQPLDLIHPEDQRRIRAEMAGALERSTLHGATCAMIRKDGSSFPAELSGASLKDAHGHPIRAVVLVLDCTQRKRFEEELRQLPRRIIEAQESERLRVALELHDGVNQIIASAKMRLRKVQSAVAALSPAAREILARCEKLLVQALEENRRIAHNLHPSVLDELGLAAACRALCQELHARTNLKVRCADVSLSQRLAPTAELNLFRIVQESLNNIEKHARAKTVNLQLAIQGDSVVLEIKDDGCGFDPLRVKPVKAKRSGIGLTSLRERAAILGGTFEFASTSKHGTTILVRVPRANIE